MGIFRAIGTALSAIVSAIVSEYRFCHRVTKIKRATRTTDAQQWECELTFVLISYHSLRATTTAVFDSIINCICCGKGGGRRGGRTRV